MAPHSFTCGDTVIDRDDDSDSPSSAVVIACPEITCDDWTVPGTGQTVADYNPDYSADDAVVTIAFRTDLAQWDDWQDTDPTELAAAVHRRNIRSYSYPASRLMRDPIPESDTEPPLETTTPSETDHPTSLPSHVTIWFDGACEPQNPGGHGTYGIVIAASDDGAILVTDRGYIGHGEGVTNNVAEYTALIEALDYVHEHGATAQVIVHGDSQLVIRQLTGEYRVKSERLQPLWRETRQLARDLNVTFEWIPREQNEHADGLSRRAYHEHVHAETIKRNRTRARAEWHAGEFPIQPLAGDDEPAATDQPILETATTFEVKQQYLVNLRTYSCTCPYSQYQNLPCKHLLGVEWVRDKRSARE